MSRSGRAITALAATLLALPALLPVTTASAADSTGEYIANALSESPVYVDEAYAKAVPPSHQRELARQIKRTVLPVKVVLLPLTKGDDFGGEADVLASVVRDHLPHRDLILITTDGDFTDSLNGYEWPADTHQTEDAVAATGFLDETRDAGLADLASKAVELVAEGDGTRVYEEATRDLGRTPASEPPSTTPERSSGWPTWATVTATLSALTLLAVGLGRLVAVARRRRRRTTPRQVFATARAADETAVRARAEAEVLALADAVRAADPARAPGLGAALDAYEAAGKVLDSARGLPDLAGVLALVAKAEDALNGSLDALPLCFFNPLHGRAAHRTTWRPLGRRDRTDVAACPTCTTALRTHRSPEVLTDVTEAGETVPYFEVRSVWAATGYGSLRQGLVTAVRARPRM